MSSMYELWDAQTRNLVSAHASEAEALTFVRQYVHEHGAHYPSMWALLCDDDAADEAKLIAEGHALVARAHDSERPDVSLSIHSKRRAG